MRWNLLPLLLFFSVFTLGIWPSIGDATGPWKAHVVDAETGKPLEGVVVLAYWIKYTSTAAGLAGPEFYDAEEVVTGPDGRFVIQGRWTFTLLPWTHIRGPELVIFKPGYGQWRFQGSKDWPDDAYEQDTRTKKAWEQFRGEGVVIELPLLKTREERLEFYRSVTWSLVPQERTKRLREALDEERVYLGFRRMYEVKP
ncbi:hypothetical protein EPO44_00410 [bacterium]|nr:MAG: hypothetical protein EPO44_00410 [bacterium]